MFIYNLLNKKRVHFIYKLFSRIKNKKSVGNTIV